MQHLEALMEQFLQLGAVEVSIVLSTLVTDKALQELCASSSPADIDRAFPTGETASSAVPQKTRNKINRRSEAKPLCLLPPHHAERLQQMSLNYPCVEDCQPE